VNNLWESFGGYSPPSNWPELFTGRFGKSKREGVSIEPKMIRKSADDTRPNGWKIVRGMAAISAGDDGISSAGRRAWA
jgi:hypothetical protein